MQTQLVNGSASVAAQIAAPNHPASVAVNLKSKAVYRDDTSTPNLPNEADLRQSLLRIISEKTGYPLNAVNLDMDIEADLGIDSIKRVEILGAVQDLYPDLPQVELETLAELRTFNQAITLLRPADSIPEQSAPAESGPDQSAAKPAKVGIQAEAQVETAPKAKMDPLQREANHSIKRRAVQLQFLPKPDWIERTPPPGAVTLLTDNGSPLTVQLAEALQAKGWKVVVLRFPNSLVKRQVMLPKAIERVSLSSLTADHLCQQVKKIEARYGAIAVLIHLDPSANLANINQDNQAKQPCTIRITTCLQQVFLLAKYLQPSLTQAAAAGFAGFFTVTHLDGELGLSPTAEFHPVNAGLLGLTKSLSREWDQVMCRSIDLSPELTTEQMTAAILAELHDPNRLLAEVGYSIQGRSTLVCQQLDSLDLTDSTIEWNNRSNTGCNLDPDTIFLVSGGAKGITAECVIKLAQTYSCQFVLLGRSPLTAEPDWAKGYTGAALKQQIMQHLTIAGKAATPVEIQPIFQQIEAQRAITETLQAIEQAGGRAEYISVDITDSVALQNELQAALGAKINAVKGVIHGAGNLADKRIEKKTLQDFTTVFDVKVQGLENLLRCVPVEQLEYLVLFSSVVGFYGNAGQTDYAAANEVLNKTAHLVQQNHPGCHVVAFNWGPWENGMVTPELKRLFAQHKVKTISVEQGTAHFIAELTHNQTAAKATQIVIGGPLPRPPQQPNSGLKTYQIQRRLAVADNPFLLDHMIQQHPVLPATCAMAWMANACEQLYPGYKFFKQTDFKVLKGIILDPVEVGNYTLELEEVEKQPEAIQCLAKIRSHQNGRERYHFRTHLTLVRQLPDAPLHRCFNLSLGAAMLPDTAIYSSTSGLFHGPAFQGIQRVLNFSPDHITVECRLPNFSNHYYGQFPVQSLNPYIADVQLQPLLLWTQHFHQQGCLPSEAADYEQFAEIVFDQPFYVSAQIISKNRTAVIANMVTHDRDGRVYSRLFGAKGVILPLAKLLALSEHQ
ncbi:SDR family NAD(P)-dependent oxidoreductase [Leptolyngbya sp. 7M]|uniref:SDR family NAD(P)-dependent oxidoreductase n=1 Tax=Leptolyngbya sp. 7M TaxID=2812896 RepID=UPI001B8C1726|nr:SDR family NAD(P)-dependent oxidoreductase [Leptolyngbya sp. 7M]QYO67473.1 SDR family NAD(P)-dependent oxidoreductase [Leptolyngbya sp. 7M]